LNKGRKRPKAAERNKISPLLAAASRDNGGACLLRDESLDQGAEVKGTALIVASAGFVSGHAETTRTDSEKHRLAEFEAHRTGKTGRRRL